MDPEQRQAYNADLDRSLQDEDDGYTGELLSRWCANTRMGKNEDPEESRGVFVVRGRRGAALLYPRLGRGWQAWPGREAWAEDTALRRFPFQPPPPPGACSRTRCRASGASSACGAPPPPSAWRTSTGGRACLGTGWTRRTTSRWAGGAATGGPSQGALPAHAPACLRVTTAPACPPRSSGSAAGRHGRLPRQLHPLGGQGRPARPRVCGALQGEAAAWCGAGRLHNAGAPLAVRCGSGTPRVPSAANVS
jgi:hypothetical protein